MQTNRMIALTVLSAFVAGPATPAAAYIGPGAGLGAIGTAIAVLLAILLLLAGFVWYPLRRLLRKRRKDTTKAGQSRTVDGE